MLFLICFGAGDEARTRYLHLGKVALYRMSYTRANKNIIITLRSFVKYFFRKELTFKTPVIIMITL